MRVKVTAPLLVPPIVVSTTVADFLTEVILFEILNGLWVARVNGTSTAELVEPCEATTWHVVAEDEVKSVPIMRQLEVFVVNTTLELLPPDVESFTTEPDGKDETPNGASRI
jgi:hypothetical protein